MRSLACIYYDINNSPFFSISRNFLVFQGDVESIASKSSKELTTLFEHICGSNSLKSAYEEVLRQKNEAEEKTVFSMQKKKIFSTQRKEVKDQKDEAEEFQLKQEELHQLKTEYTLWRTFELKLSVEEYQSEMEKDEDAFNNAKEKIMTIDAEVASSKKSLAVLSKAVTKSEKERLSSQKLLLASSLDLNTLRAKIQCMRHRVAELVEGKGLVEKDLNDQKMRIRGLQKDIIALSNVETRLMQEQSKEEARTLQLSGNDLEEYQRLREELATRVATDRANELAISKHISSSTLGIQRLESQHEAVTEGMTVSKQQAEEYSSQLQRLIAAISDDEQEENKLLQTKNILREKMQICSDITTSVSAEIEEIDNMVREAGYDRRRSQNEQRKTEALESMKQILPGIHGKLIDLCRPIQKKYSQAIAIAAGKHMDAIVVDSKQTASEFIRYMKDQRIGTCTLLPLDNIESKPISNRLRALGIKYRVCQDVVEVDDMFRPAISYALGSTIVCDTLEDAQDLCFNRGETVKVVTLSGHKIGKSGAMTGGASPNTARDRWEEKEIEKLMKRKAQLEKQLSDNKHEMPSSQSLLDLEIKQKALQTRRQYNRAEEKVLEEKLSQINQQNSIKSKLCREINNEKLCLEKNLKTLNEEIEKLHQNIKSVEVEVLGEFSNAHGVANICEYETLRLQEHQDTMQKLGDILQQKATMSAQLEYETKRDFEGSLKRLHIHLDESMAELQDLELEEKRLGERERETQLTSDRIEITLKQLKENLKNESVSAKALHKKRASISGISCLLYMTIIIEILKHLIYF